MLRGVNGTALAPSASMVVSARFVVLLALVVISLAADAAHGNHRLARGLHLCAQSFVERAVAHDHHLYGNAVLVLDLRGVASHGLREGVRLVVLVLPRALGLVQPVPQVALLGAGEAAHLVRAVRVALYQCQRVQHRVVDVRRDLRQRAE